MKNRNPIIVIMKRELGSYFANPACYIVTGLFLIFSGIFFFSTFFLVNRAELRSFFNFLPVSLSLFVPAITMRIFAEEKRSGSYETLMTLPVTERQVVLGKFLAAVIEACSLFVPTISYVITARCFGELDAGPVIAGYIASILLAGTISSIGLFTSATTRNQIIAFFAGAAIAMVLTLAGKLLIFMPSAIVGFVSFLSISTHFEAISRGIVDSRDIIYFISVTAVFLLLAVNKIKSEK